MTGRIMCDCDYFSDDDNPKCKHEAVMKGSDGLYYCEIHFNSMSSYKKITGTPVKAKKSIKEEKANGTLC